MKNIISLVGTTEAIIIDDDKWQLMPNANDELNISSLYEDSLSAKNLIIPFELWLEVYNTDAKTCSIDGINAFSVENTTDVTLLKPWLNSISLIVLDFPLFTDGRAYSQAVEIRRHLGWQGQIRAKGHVLRDQLSHMYRCGFNSFAISEDKEPADALKGLAGISVAYANSVTEPKPLFRRRRS